MAAALLHALFATGEVGRETCSRSRPMAPSPNLRHVMSQHDVSSNETLRYVMQLRGDKHVRIAEGLYIWDWRYMSPWLRRRRDKVREFCMEPHEGGQVHLKGDQAVLDGQWDFHPRCSGSFTDLVFRYSTIVMDGRELMLLNGGSWEVRMCELRASGMQVLRCQRDSRVDMSKSVVGGITFDPYEPDAKQDYLRASNGLVAIETSRASLHSCELSMTGLLDGSALKASGTSSVKASECTFMQNVVSVFVSQNCAVLVEDSVFMHKRLSHLLVGPPLPSNARLSFFRNRGVGSLWGLNGRPKVWEERDNFFPEQEEKSNLELLRENFAYVPLYENKEIGEKPDWLLAREGGYLIETGDHIVYCLTCGNDNNLNHFLTCQHCYDPRQQFQRKYGLGDIINVTALFDSLQQEKREKREFRRDEDIERARQMAETTRQWPWTRPKELQEVKARSKPVADFLASTQRLHAVEELRTNFTEAYKEKETLKAMYRSRREEDVRVLLVQAQEKYAQARAAFVKALDELPKKGL